MQRVFGFPETVNETAARVVAAGVVSIAALTLVSGQGWLLVPLVYGFAARVLTGPKLSPLGLVATRVVAPRLAGPHRQAPGAPKRFAQGIGLAVSSVAAIAWVAGYGGVATAALAGLIFAAGLEAGLGLCLGCAAYRRLFGCPDCDDITARLDVALATPLSKR